MLKILLWPTFIILIPCMGIPIIGAIMLPFVTLLAPATPWVILNCIIAILSLVAAGSALSLLALYIDFLVPAFKLASKSKTVAVVLSNFGAILVLLALAAYASIGFVTKALAQDFVFSSITSNLLIFLAGVPFLFAYAQLKFTIYKANKQRDCRTLRARQREYT